MSISSPERLAIERGRLRTLEQAPEGRLSRAHILAVRIEGAFDARVSKVEPGRELGLRLMAETPA